MTHRYSKPRRTLWRTQHRLNPNKHKTPTQLQKTLAAYGFPPGRIDGDIGPQTEAAVRYFQAAFNGGKTNQPTLTPDGVAGPKTRQALTQLPHLSAHFTANELWSRGNGDCYVKRQLLHNLEQLRKATGGRPMRLKYGAYRDPAYNKKIGGATRSRHPEGDACDIGTGYGVTLGFVRKLKLFTGIGYYPSRHNLVSHVDTRPGNVNHPTTWKYH